jgi:hypothetical protein
VARPFKKQPGHFNRRGVRLLLDATFAFGASRLAHIYSAEIRMICGNNSF